MDPITQSLLGAAAAQSAFTRTLGRAALPIGLVGGEIVDLDVFLTPWADPALPFELHRHFTHALLFVPIGGALAAAPFLLVPALRAKWRSVVGAATLACATHALLDNCTSYGTHLLLPFDAGRTAWDIMPIIDPIFTAILFAGVLWSAIAARARPALVALVLALSYIGFGAVQHGRAAEAQRRLAAERGHVVDDGRVMPTIGNVIVWRSIYRADGRLWADAVRTPLFGAAAVRQGTSRPRFTADDLPHGGARDERIRAVFDATERFATGYMAEVERDASEAGRPGMRGIVLGDMRYSYDPAAFRPIWGLRIDVQRAGDPVEAIGFRGARADLLPSLWREIIGDVPGYVPVSDGHEGPRRADGATPR